jgi:hypothetical protein
MNKTRRKVAFQIKKNNTIVADKDEGGLLSTAFKKIALPDQPNDMVGEGARCAQGEAFTRRRP